MQRIADIHLAKRNKTADKCRQEKEEEEEDEEVMLGYEGGALLWM